MKKPTAHITLNGESPNAFPRSETRQGCNLFYTQNILEGKNKGTGFTPLSFSTQQSEECGIVKKIDIEINGIQLRVQKYTQTFMIN